MKESGIKTRELFGLLTDSPIKRTETENQRIYWRNQSPVNHRGFVEEAIELVIPPSTATRELLKFMVELDNILQAKDSRGFILSESRSRRNGTIITVLLEPTKVDNLVIKLTGIPEVEKAEEELLARGFSSRFSPKFATLLTSNTSPSRIILLGLKETVVAEKEFATLLN